MSHRGYEKEAAESRYVIGRKASFMNWIRTTEEYEHGFTAWFNERLRSSCKITIGAGDGITVCLWVKSTCLIYDINRYDSSDTHFWYRDEIPNVAFQNTQFTQAPFADWQLACEFCRVNDAYAVPVCYRSPVDAPTFPTWFYSYVVKHAKIEEVYDIGEGWIKLGGVKWVLRSFYEKIAPYPMKAEFFWDFQTEEEPTPAAASIAGSTEFATDQNLDLYGFKVMEGWDYTQIFGLFVAKPLKSSVDKAATALFWSKFPHYRGTALICYYSYFGSREYFIMPTFGKTQYKLVPKLTPAMFNVKERYKFYNELGRGRPYLHFSEHKYFPFFEELNRDLKKQLLGLDNTNWFLGTGMPLSSILGSLGFDATMAPPNAPDYYT